MRRMIRRLWRGLLWIVGVAAVASIVADFVFVDYHQASQELPRALAEYRAEGLPWLASDIVTPPPPEHENAAEPLRRAIAALPKNGVDYSPGGNYPYGTAESLTGHKRFFALLEKAVERRRLDFRRDLDLGAFVLFPEEAGVKQSVRVLTARAELRSRKGNDDGALADLDAARRLVALIAQDRGIIAALVAASCEAMVCGQVRQCLATAVNDPRRLRRYRDWLARPAPLLDLHRAYRDEIFMSVANARNLDKLGVGTSWNPLDDMDPFMCHYPNDEPYPELTAANVRRDGLPEALRARAYLARLLQMFTELSRGTGHLADPLDKIAIEGETIVEKYASPFTTSHAFDNIFFSVFGQFGRTNRRIVAARAVALTYADALLLHATTGHWPTACNVPDPLGDGYLRVRTEQGRFRVWSAGNNGIDENGLVRYETIIGKSSDDLVAAYPPIPRPTTSHTAPPPVGFGRPD